MQPDLTQRMTQLFRFAWLEVQCCLFAVAVFAGLAVSKVVPLPVARYDALLAYALLLTVVFYLLRLETAREVAVIFGFHLIGLALELFKVRVGSWSYPEQSWAKIAGVPLYAGFMYAAVGSYICQASVYTLDGTVWRQRWELCERTDDELIKMSAAVGLRALSLDGAWVTASSINRAE